MQRSRPFARSLARLKGAGLRSTRQRLALARLLFDGDDRHVTAEQLHNEAVEAGIRISLATVYNSLHQFTEAGLLREVLVDPARIYFDTNTSDHHHFFASDTGQLQDIPAHEIVLGALPPTPGGTAVERVDVIVRLRAGDGKQPDKS